MTSHYRKGICDIVGLDDRLIELLEKEVECPHLEKRLDLSPPEQVGRAMNYLATIDWENVPENSWRSLVPQFLRSGWGVLSPRERALVYIFTVECPIE